MSGYKVSKPNKNSAWSSVIIYSLLGILILGAFYFRSHADYVYAQIANWYYKHNEITKAQYFYEKSFLLGNSDAAARGIYINSIINSPLTVESQEKLARIAEDKIQDGASLKAKEFLYNLKREIHRQYPDNYIKQCPFNQKVIHWSRFPITYTFNNSKNVPQEYIEEINKAFAEWEKAGVVLFTQTDDYADIEVNFRNNKNENMEYGRKYVVAYTVPVVFNSVLNRMDINFYIQDPEGHNFTANQIYNTALHEIFHALGFMGHSFDSDNIMYLAKDNKSIINDIRAVLTNADKSTLRLLYKIKPDITNEGELKSEYIPYLVLGDDEEVNISKSREAKNYIYHAPTLPSGYIDLAESLVAQKHYPEAIKNLEKALYLSGTNEMKYISYYNLGVVYYYINHASMALDYINKAKEIKDNAELHQLKAEIFSKAGDKRSAIKEYEYLIQINSDNSNYVLRLADLYIQDKKYMEARKVLKTYLKKHPEDRRSSSFSSYGLLLF